MRMLNRVVSRRRKVEGIILVLLLLIAAACWWRMPEDAAGLLRNTVKLANRTLLISMPTAIVLAFALTRWHVPGKRFWEACLLALLFMPLYIQLASWEAGFGRGGWYSMLIAAKLSNPPLEDFRGAVWVHAMAAIPWLFWIFRLGLVAVPRTYKEAASLDGTALQTFLRITLPLSLPAFVAGGLYVFIVTATEITVTDRYQFRSYAEVLYNEFVLSTRFDALPLSVAPVVINLVVVTALGLAICKLLWPTIVHATVTRPRTQAEPVNWIAFMVVAATVSLLLFLPVANLLYQAGIDVRQVEGQGRERIWSAAKLVKIVTSSPIVFSGELAWTALISQLSVFAALGLATLAGWWALNSYWRQLCCALVGVICFVTPGPFIGLALIWLLNRSNPAILGMLYDDTVLAPWLAQTIRCFPFALLIIWYGLRSIPKTILEAAAADGASSIRSLWHVGLPMLQTSLICAAIVCLAISVGELSASILVMPAGVSTVSSRIFSLIHYGADDELAGLCLSCLGLMIGLALLARAAFRHLRPSFA